MLRLLDIFFTLLHLIIIIFNLCGWMFPATLRIHFYSILLTAFSWLVLGYWYGFGYCPITDWQWQIKERLGETDLPDSFIKYFADKMSGKNISANLIDFLTLAGFTLSTFISVYLNFLKGRWLSS